MRYFALVVILCSSTAFAQVKYNADGKVARTKSPTVSARLNCPCSCNCKVNGDGTCPIACLIGIKDGSVNEVELLK